jgi:hypothetical protein
MQPITVSAGPVRQGSKESDLVAAPAALAYSQELGRR